MSQVTNGDARAPLPADSPAGATAEALTGRPTLERQTEVLLGALPSMNAYEVARQVGTTAARVLQFWRSLGFAGVPASAPVFAPSDVEALRSAFALVDELGLSEDALRALVRGAAHSADRLAVWQLEALVADAEKRFELDDVSARLVVVDTVGATIAPLEALVTHAWRRHLLSLLDRTERSVAHLGNLAPEEDALPLERAVGFCDLVAYTSRTLELGAAELAELVAGFEERARDAVTGVGARIVKTMGDGVLFVADDLETGLRAALGLGETYRDGPLPLEVHGAVTWGRILPRSGDIFGPSVNLAARLADLASPGQLLTDLATWQLIEGTGLGGTLVSGAVLPPAQAYGIGAVDPVLLSRARAG